MKAFSENVLRRRNFKSCVKLFPYIAYAALPHYFALQYAGAFPARFLGVQVEANTTLRPSQSYLEKLVSPARRRQCIDCAVIRFGLSKRLACGVLGQHRSTQRKTPRGRVDDAVLTADIVELATQYGRYGSCWISALLQEARWLVNLRRVERIWRQEVSR